VAGVSRTVIASNAVLNLGSSDPVSLDSRTLENAGKVNWSGTADFILSYDAVINNQTNGVFEAQSDAGLLHSGGNQTFYNYGTFRKRIGGTGTNIVYAYGGGFNNYGFLEVQSGTVQFFNANNPLSNAGLVTVSNNAILQVFCAGSSSGSFDVAAGGLVDFNSVTYTLNPGAQLNGAGLYTNRNVLTVNTPNVVVQNFGLTGTLNGTGTLTMSSNMNWTAGSMTDAGKTVIASNAVLNVGSAVGVYLGGRTLENAGTVIWTGAGDFSWGYGAVINNLTGGVFEAQSNAGLMHTGGGYEYFYNYGTFRKRIGTGTNTVYAYTGFNNYGTVDLQSGFVSFINGFFPSSSSTINIPLAGATAGTGFGQMQVSGGVTLAGALTTSLVNGFYPTTNALFTFLTAGSRGGTFANFFYPSNDVGMKVTNTTTTSAILVINVRPVLDPIADQTNDELAPFLYPATAHDDDRPAQTLTFTLTNSPAGATINPTTGQISWMPSEAQGPMTTNLTVRVTDNGTPNLTVARTFQLVVNEINLPPVLTPQPDTNINEGVHFTATATATDSDIPTNPLTFALVSGPPGLTVSTNGVIDWTPGEVQGPSTNTVLISVTDTNPVAVNAKSLSVTNSFQIVVNEVNLPPVLTVPANQVIVEQTLLAVFASATDPDLPPNPLTFALVSPPTGMVIDPGSGLISWTPAEDQGPSTNTITVVVTDDSPFAINAHHLSVTNTFFVTVMESNSPPVLTLPADTNINELVIFTALATATDPDIPTNALTFALVSGPAGLTVSTNGEINWKPDESQCPSTNTVTISVTDTNPIAVNATSLSVTSSFQIVVSEVNVAPVLTLPADTNINEMVAFSALATATDSDIPVNPLTFALISGPAGLTVSSGGIINWTPDESQGPSTNTVTISVTDTNPIAVNATSLSVTGSFQIIVQEVNLAPVLGPLSDYTLNAGQTLSFTATATDADLPTNTLTFSLLGAPADATITSEGLFRWRPGVALANTTNVLQVRVQDNGVPVLNDTRSFSVIVNPLAAPVMLTPLGYANGYFTLGITGPLGPDYVIMSSTNLAQWSDLTTNPSPVLPFQHTDTSAGAFSNRNYRVRLQP
jgi:hypothetical protein